MALVNDNLISEAAQEVETLMNFVAGQVNRVNTIFINKLPTNEKGIVITAPNGNLYLEVSSVFMNTAPFEKTQQLVFDTLDGIESGVLGWYSDKYGATPQSATGDLSAAKQEATQKLKNNINSDNILDNLTQSEMVDNVYRMSGEQRYTIQEIKDAAHETTRQAVNKYGNNRVLTPMETYSRNIQEILNRSYDEIEDFFLYQGAEDEKNREFCANRVGLVYHRAEIEAWPQDEGFEWLGILPGTDASNIFVALGGFSCRHQLIPQKLSEVPEAVIARAHTKGLLG